MLTLGVQALGIEITRLAYVSWNVAGFTVTTVAMGVVFILLSRPCIRREMLQRATGMVTN